MLVQGKDQSSGTPQKCWQSHLKEEIAMDPGVFYINMIALLSETFSRKWWIPPNQPLVDILLGQTTHGMGDLWIISQFIYFLRGETAAGELNWIVAMTLGKVGSTYCFPNIVSIPELLFGPSSGSLKYRTSFSLRTHLLAICRLNDTDCTWLYRSWNADCRSLLYWTFLVAQIVQQTEIHFYISIL